MSNKLAIMQPYFFPYIGYFQLLNSVDKFVIYDNIQYTKKGWINRNRILSQGMDALISIPIKNDSDFLDVVDRKLSSTWKQDRKKILNKIKNSYSKAPYYKTVLPIVEEIINFDSDNLFDFIHRSLCIINEYLEIKTEIIISSSVKIDHKNLKSKDKVIAICKELKSDVYINAIGGVDLYDKEDFKNNGIQLNFIKSNPIKYNQFENEFVPWLSIIDVMMFNSKDEISTYINDYKLV